MNILILHIKTFSLTLKFIFIAPDFEDMEVSCALGSVPTGPNVESTLTGWLIRQAVHEVLGQENMMCLQKMCVLLQQAKLKAFLLIFKMWGLDVFH